MRTPTLLALNCVCLLAAAPFNQAAAGFRPLGYDTPSYIDCELTSYSVAEDSPTLTITLVRQGDFRRYSSLDYSTTDGTALGGSDFKPTGGTIVFAPGETRKTVEITLLQDSEAEETEDFYLTLSNEDPNTILFRPSVPIQIENATPVQDLPRLEITPAPDAQIQLAWENGDSEYLLERSTSPLGTNWEPVETPPEIFDGRSTLLQSISGPHYFYRLRAR